MKLLFVALLLAASQHLVSQPMHLSILGRETYTHHPDHYVFDLGYPNSEYEHDVNLQLRNALDSLGIEYSIDSTLTQKSSPYRNKTYAVTTHTAHQFDLIKQQAELLGIEGISSYQYSNTPNETQDSLALLAFEDAHRRAQIMAKHLGRRISKIVNIDDQVEQYLFYFDRKMRNRCELERVKKIMELFALLADGSSSIQSDIERTGQYALWVTFELK